MDRDATDSGLERQPASITEATFHPAPGDFLEVSVVIPCLNEANSLGICVDKAVNALRAANLRGEVVVADNGSTDGSIEIAAKHGARIVHVAQRGYGAALNAGMQASHGRFIVMGDADDSYDFSQVPAFRSEMARRLRRRDGQPFSWGHQARGDALVPQIHRQSRTDGGDEYSFSNRRRRLPVRPSRLFARDLRPHGCSDHGNGMGAGICN